jgi:hypothetical protein
LKGRPLQCFHCNWESGYWWVAPGIDTRHLVGTRRGQLAGSPNHLLCSGLSSVGVGERGRCWENAAVDRIRRISIAGGTDSRLVLLGRGRGKWLDSWCVGDTAFAVYGRGGLGAGKSSVMLRDTSLAGGRSICSDGEGDANEWKSHPSRAGSSHVQRSVDPSPSCWYSRRG